MKKILVIIILAITIMSVFQIMASNQVLAANDDAQGELADMATNLNKDLNWYNEKYGKSYGVAAYILNTIRVYSIPVCLVGVAMGGIFCYIIGARRLPMREKGFGLIVGFITALVIAQILPLIFVVIVRGWRS